jgi:hypothetical protein
MEHSPSWGANRSSPSQGIPRILWNPKVRYRIHNRPPHVPVLSQINLVHAPHHASWESILILSSDLRLCLPSGLFPLGLPHQNPICACPVLHTCHMTHPSYSFLFDHANNIWWAVQTTKPLVMYFSPLPCYLVRLRPKYFLSTNFWNILSLRCPLSVRDQCYDCRILLRNGGAIRIRLQSNVLPYFSDRLY